MTLNIKAMCFNELKDVDARYNKIYNKYSKYGDRFKDVKYIF